MRHLLVAIIAALCALIVPSSAALIDGFNHDEYHWTVLETEHFRIIHHQGLEEAARVAAEHAETVYPKVTAALDVTPGERTDVILGDYTSVGIFAGSAFPLRHMIYLYGVTIYGGRGDRDEVLRSVLTHEFTHVCQYWKFRRGGSLGSITEILNESLTPGWFIEGTAEAVAELVEEGESSLDYHGNSLLRCAVLEGDLTSLAGMDTKDWDDITDISLTYRVGQSLSAYIARKWGPDAWGRLMREHSKFPFFDDACHDILGLHEKDLYKQWLAETRQYYRDLVAGRSDVRAYTAATPAAIQQALASAWSPDGKRIAVMGYKDIEEYQPGLYLARPDGSDTYNIAFELDQLRSTRFSWSPDGRYLVYSGYFSRSNGRVITGLFVHDVETGKRRLITEGQVAMDPAWSPLGDRIAFVLIRESGLRHDLASIRPDGTDLRILTDGDNMPAAAYAPAWSPDGTRIVCEVNDDKGGNLAILNADGSGYEMLTDDADTNRSPAWSPDGSRIAFLCARATLTDLWTVDLQTREFSRLTDEAVAQVSWPNWTPDSQGLSFALVRAQTGMVRTVPVSHVIETLTAAQKQTAPPKEEGAAEHPPAGTGIEGVSGAANPPATAPEATAQPEEEPKPYDASTWRTYPYDSTDRYGTWIVAPNSVDDGMGTTVGATYRGADPLNQQNVRVATSYGLVSRRPNLDITYTNAKNRATWQAYVFDHAPSSFASAVAAGANRLAPRGRGFDVRASYLRAVGSSTYRREVFELGAHVENASAFRIGGVTPDFPLSGWLSYIEGRWVRTKHMPSRGDWTWAIVGRQSIPGVSQYPLQEVSGLAEWDYSSSAGRQMLMVRLEAGTARTSSWFAQSITGAFIRPTLSYRFRLANDALPGLWPFLYLDRVDGVVTYQYNHNYGIPLYRDDGHALSFEVENTGYFLQAIPYRFRAGVLLDSRTAPFRPQPYWRFELNVASF